MIKFTFTVSADEFSEIVISELQKHYVDQVTSWKHEPYASNLQNALLTVIEFYMIPSEYELWYENVKEL